MVSLHDWLSFAPNISEENLVSDVDHGDGPSSEWIGFKPVYSGLLTPPPSSTQSQKLIETSTLPQLQFGM